MRNVATKWSAPLTKACLEKVGAAFELNYLQIVTSKRAFTYAKTHLIGMGAIDGAKIPRRPA